jgi:pimeloyl-ACP methyl ester carboxylesterase
MKSRALIRLAAAVIAVGTAIPVTAAAQSAAPRFDNVRLSTGIRLHYAEQGDGPAEPIILLHGLSDSWFSFSGVLPLLSVQRRVYALDLRGHGDSDRPATGYHPRDLAADVVAFLDAKGIDRATILGHSMGSFVAQQVAAIAQNRISRLILVGSGTSARAFNGMAEFEVAAKALRDPVSTAFLREFQVSTIHQGVSDEFIDRAVAESSKLPARVWGPLVDGLLATELPPSLGTLGIPTLVMWGEKDAYAPRTEQDALVRRIRSASLKSYPNTGHAPHWERPAVFARDVLAFVARPVAN